MCQTSILIWWTTNRTDFAPNLSQVPTRQPPQPPLPHLRVHLFEYTFHHRVLIQDRKDSDLAWTRCGAFGHYRNWPSNQHGSSYLYRTPGLHAALLSSFRTNPIWHGMPTFINALSSTLLVLINSCHFEANRLNPALIRVEVTTRSLLHNTSTKYDMYLHCGYSTLWMDIPHCGYSTLWILHRRKTWNDIGNPTSKSSEISPNENINIYCTYCTYCISVVAVISIQFFHYGLYAAFGKYNYCTYALSPMLQYSWWLLIDDPSAHLRNEHSLRV